MVIDPLSFLEEVPHADGASAALERAEHRIHSGAQAGPLLASPVTTAGPGTTPQVYLAMTKTENLVQSDAAPAAVDTVQMPRITAADYSDRQRLLFHITYLSTQLQRAQLLLEEEKRTIVILQAAAHASLEAPSAAAGSVGASSSSGDHVAPIGADGNGSVVTLRIASSCATAAVAAARDEEELQAALQASMGLFDPALAESHIHRLDSALAQVSLMREAELQRLSAAEAKVDELRTERNSLVEKAESCQSQWETLRREHDELKAALTSATLEVAHLRQEEARLNRRVAGLEGLMESGNAMMNGVSVTGGAATVGPTPKPSTVETFYDSGLEELMVNEAAARQALLQQLFWEPMVIAFDAGLTWHVETEELRATRLAEEAVAPLEGDNAEEVVVYDANGNAAIASTRAAPPSDLDLLLMRSLHDETVTMKGQLHVLQDRVRVANMESTRIRTLYEAEQRRSEQLARDHAAQLQRAYEELVKDRKAIAVRLQQDIETQVRQAFQDGRQHERERWQGSVGGDPELNAKTAEAPARAVRRSATTSKRAHSYRRNGTRKAVGRTGGSSDSESA